MQETGTITEQEEGEGGGLFIQTKLYHTSGECLSSPCLVLKPDKNTVQGMGGAITYGRRYQLTTMLGIAGEDDNDGNDTLNNAQRRAKNVHKISKPSVSRCVP